MTITDQLRRKVPALAALLAVLQLACGRDNTASNNTGTTPSTNSLTVVSYGGGDYQRSHEVAFLRPFSQTTGISVASVVWNAEYSRLEEMVRSGNVTWDVVEVTAAQFARGTRDSLFAPLPIVFDSTSFRPLDGGPTIDRWGVPNVYWSTVLAFRKDKYAANRSPKAWSDFFNVRDFPGPRALYDDPRGTLEFALLADGVSREQLYPLQLDRAFRKLETIRSHVKVWWSDGTEPVRLLLTNQVAMTPAWSGRIFASASAKSELAYTWNGAAHELDYWIVPKGSRNAAQAADFIRFASSPGPMATQAAMVAYGPANAVALDSVAPGLRPSLPTYGPNWAQSFVVNSAWWSANEQAVRVRWLKWRGQ